MSQVAAGRSAIQIIDYTGHPFTAELARNLRLSGVEVSYTYCASYLGPKGDFEALDALEVPVSSVDLGHPFETRRIPGRLRDEVLLGIRLAAASFRSEGIVVACQLPVLSGLLLRVAVAIQRRDFVLWLQDLQADLVAITAPAVVRVPFELMETLYIRAATRVLCISEPFSERVRQMGRKSGVAVLQNWAPIDAIPVVDRNNRWSSSVGLPRGAFRVIYAGTMGVKHRASDLRWLAESLTDDPEIGFVVVSAGSGFQEFKEAPTPLDSEQIVCLPPQDIQDLPYVLGAADVLIFSLASEANEASIPSKVLSYLCAGRAVIGLAPADNPSSMVVVEAKAGLIALTRGEALDMIRQLRDDPELRHECGQSARRFAEHHFSSPVIVESFLAAIDDRARRSANVDDDGSEVLN